MVVNNKVEKRIKIIQIEFRIPLDKGASTILASISQPHKTILQYKKGDLQIQGTLSNRSISYLSLTWPRPTDAEAGQYGCYAHARDFFERDTLFQSTLKIRLDVPSFSDLLNFSRKQAALNEDQDAMLVEISKQIRLLQERLDNNSRDIDVAKTELVSLQPRVEEGVVACGNSANFKVEGPTTSHCLPFREFVNYVSFKTPYTRTPSVNLNLEFIDLAARTTTRFYYYKKNITPNGFLLACGTWCDTHIYTISIRWQATNS